jgi:mannosyltransferase OCH1-like enzyme
METIIQQIEEIRNRIDQEWEKENPDYRKISFYEDMVRSMKEDFIEEMM